MKKVVFTLMIMITLFSFSNVKASEKMFPEVLWKTSFESEEEQAFWTFHDLDGDGHNWEYKSIEEDTVFMSYEGKFSLYSESFTSRMQILTPDNLAISKAIEIDETKAPYIDINWYVASQEAYHNKEQYSVYIFKGTETDNDIVTKIKDNKVLPIFNEIMKEETIAFFQRSLEITNILKELYPNENDTKSIKIVFRHHDSTAQRAIKIENVMIDTYYKYDTLSNYTFKEDMEGWTSIDGDGDGYGWEYKNESENLNFRGVDDQSVLASASYIDVEEKALTPKNYLISPEIKIDEKYYFYHLNWYAGAYDKVYFQEQYSVYIYTGNDTLNKSNIKAKLNDSGISSLIYNGTIKEPSDYNEFEFNFKLLDEKYKGKKVRIVFVHNSEKDQYYLKLDNIALYGALPTEKDTNVPETPETPEVPELVKGDWNGNGTIDIQDLARARLFWAGDETYEEPELEVVDMNENGKHDLTDLEKIRTYLAEKYTL